MGCLQRSFARCGNPVSPFVDEVQSFSRSDPKVCTVFRNAGNMVVGQSVGVKVICLEPLRKKGVDLEELTLHVGAGTFKPVKSEEIEGHEMHTEYISVSRSTLRKLIGHNACAIAVGTTSVRTLLSC